MVEAPCIPAPRRPPAAHFRLPRHGRRKVHVVRLGRASSSAPQVCGRGRGLRLRWWLSRAVWRLAELCVAALALGDGHGHPGAPSAPPPRTGIEPCFAAPFVPVALMKRAGAKDIAG